jgi:hypothetical protein
MRGPVLKSPRRRITALRDRLQARPESAFPIIPPRPLGGGNHEEITVILIKPTDGAPALVRVHWPLRPTTAAATHYRAVSAAIVRMIAESATALAQGGRAMSNNLRAFVMSAGGLLAVAGAALLLLWVVVN